MAFHPAGTRNHTVRFERAVESRNAVGEVVQASWEPIARRRASVRQLSYSEADARGRQVVGQSAYEVVVPFVAGLDGSCRIVWESMGGRLLYVTSVVADETDEQTIEATEKAT